MPDHSSRTLAIALLPTLLTGLQSNAAEPTYSAIAPILQSRCVLCHSGPQAPLGLSLDSLDQLLAGSQRGPVVRAGDPVGSELFKRLKGLSLPRMPLSGPPFLSAAEITLFERWIAAGLPPGAGSPALNAAANRPATPSPQPVETVNYSHVETILNQRCVKCHSASGIMGTAPEGYLLSSYAATLAYGERARVIPGSAGASELVRRIRGQARPRMPYDGPPFLDDREIALIVAWVEQGARDAQGRPAAMPRGAKLRLHGTLGGNWRLDGLALKVNAATRLDHSPQAGDYVQVRGRLLHDGSVLAERIRPR
jgi:mono/diheme cytochrome c family protein